MILTDLMQKLTAVEPVGFPFLSVYINAEADRQGRDNFAAWLRKELDERGKQYETENIEERSPEAESFQKDVERILSFIETEVDAEANGIAIFACYGRDEFFETVQLEVPFPNNRFFVFDRPHIFPLARAVEQNPRYAVLWADTNKADIYIFGGERAIALDSETNAQVEEIQNTVTQRSKAGGWSQARFQRRMENFHLQHAKETVEVLEKLLRDTKIKHLILCGDETGILPILQPQLTKAVEEKVVATLHLSQYDSEDEIREATSEAMREYDARTDAEKVERVVGAAKAAAGLGVLGVKDTLAALSNGQVEELVISATFDPLKYRKKDVEEVLEAYAPGEDMGNEELPEADEPRLIGDELIIRAMNSAAEIRFIEDAELMKQMGGVGAVLRYNMNATANG